MSKLKMVTASQMSKFLSANGFENPRQAGSHGTYIGKNGRQTVIPKHKGRDLERPIIYAILKQAGLSVDEYNKYFGSSF